MPPDRSSFECVNLPTTFALPERMDYFTLTASPNTQLWRKPPADDTTTAPLIYTGLRNSFVVAEVTVTALAEYEWDQAGLVIFTGCPPTSAVRDEEEEERTGTMSTGSRRPSPGNVSSNNNIITLPDRSSPSSNTFHSTSQPAHRPANRNRNGTSTYSPFAPPRPTTKWVKAGLELTNNAVHATSVCASSHGADWSLTPIGPPQTNSSSVYGPGSVPSHEKSSLRIKFERVGLALWVWYQIPDGGGSGSGTPFYAPPPSSRTTAYDTMRSSRRAQPDPTPSPAYISTSWRKLREVSGFFWDVEDKCVYVGVYASRPTRYLEGERGGLLDQGGVEEEEASRDGLVVEFEDLEIF